MTCKTGSLNCCKQRYSGVALPDITGLNDTGLNYTELNDTDIDEMELN